MRTIKEFSYYKYTLYLLIFIIVTFSVTADQSHDVLWYDWSQVKSNYISRELFISELTGQTDKMGFISLYLLEEGRELATKSELIELLEEKNSRCLELQSEYRAEGQQVELKLTVYDQLVERTVFEKSFKFNEDYRLEIAIALETLFRRLEHYLKEYNEPLMGKMIGTFDYLLKLKGRVVAVPVYSDKTTVIIYNKNRDDYSILYKNKRYYSIDGVLPLIIDLDRVDKLEIFYSGREKRPIIIELSPEIKVKEYSIKLAAEKPPFETAFALDLSYSQSTGGYLGGDIIFSLGFKKSRAFKDSLYFKWHLSLKTVHLLEQHIDPLKATNFKLKTGVGYRHQFNINGLLSIGTGVEGGFEFYLLKMLYYSIFHYESPDNYFPGFPTFYLSIPLYIELLSFSRVAIFATFEPTFRVISKVIIHDGYLWRDNFDIEGYEKNYFRITLERSDNSSAYTALDLFLNDIPITLGVRIKI